MFLDPRDLIVVIAYFYIFPPSPASSCLTMQTLKRAAQVFFDVDGTLQKPEYHHAVFYFLQGLPCRRQRNRKMFFYFSTIYFIGALSVISKNLAMHILTYIALNNVSRQHAAVASRHVTKTFLKIMRPALLKELKQHQAAGRKVAILSGNLRPILADFARHLNVECFCTNVGVSACGQKYSGFVSGPFMMDDAKAQLVRAAKEQHTEDLYGYGNSRHDIPFLLLTDHPHAVCPDKTLLKRAVTMGWNDKFHRVQEPPAFANALQPALTFSGVAATLLMPWSYFFVNWPL
eukprot:m.118702 g.118702  ORF g.118702 m.118702 type:complete len:289 (+) comp23138_c0_seq1:316-1182(+)